MAKRFPSVRRIVEQVVYGPEPVGRAGAVVLQNYSAGALQGGRLGGVPHFGMKGDASVTYAGYVASPQRFQGAAQLGASKNLSVQDYPALPNTETPNAMPSWLQDWTRLEGVVPT